MFESTIDGGEGEPHSPGRPLSFPTNDQAEVLVFKIIERSLITGVVVPSRYQADRERARLHDHEVESKDLKIAVCPRFLDLNAVRHHLQNGPDICLDFEPL